MLHYDRMEETGHPRDIRAISHDSSESKASMPSWESAKMSLGPLPTCLSRTPKEGVALSLSAAVRAIWARRRPRSAIRGPPAPAHPEQSELHGQDFARFSCLPPALPPFSCPFSFSSASFLPLSLPLLSFLRRLSVYLTFSQLRDN